MKPLLGAFAAAALAAGTAGCSLFSSAPTGPWGRVLSCLQHSGDFSVHQAGTSNKPTAKTNAVALDNHWNGAIVGYVGNDAMGADNQSGAGNVGVQQAWLVSGPIHYGFEDTVRGRPVPTVQQQSTIANCVQNFYGPSRSVGTNKQGGNKIGNTAASTAPPKANVTSLHLSQKGCPNGEYNTSVAALPGVNSFIDGQHPGCFFPGFYLNGFLTGTTGNTGASGANTGNTGASNSNPGNSGTGGQTIPTVSTAPGGFGGSTGNTGSTNNTGPSNNPGPTTNTGSTGSSSPTQPSTTSGSTGSTGTPGSTGAGAAGTSGAAPQSVPNASPSTASTTGTGSGF